VTDKPLPDVPPEVLDLLQDHLVEMQVTRDESGVPVPGADAHWRCTCGAGSPVVPWSGKILKAAFQHQVEGAAAQTAMIEALESKGYAVTYEEVTS
jgi:hypothetical protein